MDPKRLGELVLAEDYPGIKAMFQDGPIDPMASCIAPDGTTVPLMVLAIQNDKTELVRQLLNDVDVQDMSVFATLLARRASMYDVLEEMVVRGFSPSRHTAGSTLMHAAAEEGLAPTLVLLLNLYDSPDIQDGDGRTPLHLALQNRQFQAALVLLNGGANLHVRDNHGITPLEAMLHSHDRLMRIMAIRSLKNELMSKPGVLPFDEAALLMQEPWEVVRSFVEHIDPAQRGPEGESLLFYAIHLEVARFLHESGLPLTDTDMHGRTLLHMACAHGATPSLVSWLLNNGLSPNVQDNDGMYPIHYAARWGEHDLVRLLLMHGASPDVRDGGGNTPLHYAAVGEAPGCAETMELLLDHGADPNSRGTGERTPLGWSAVAGFTEGAFLLHSRGADPYMEDSMGQTPAALAFQHGHTITAAACNGEVPDQVPPNIRKLMSTLDRFHALLDGDVMAVEPFLLLYPGVYDPSSPAQIGGAPFGVDEDMWPRTCPELLKYYSTQLGGDRDWHDDRMEHVLTVDISELGNVAPALPQDTVAVAFFHPRPDAAFLPIPRDIPHELTRAVVPITRSMLEDGRPMGQQPVRHAGMVSRRGLSSLRLDLPVVLRWITSNRAEIDGCLTAPNLESFILERIMPPAFNGDELHPQHVIPFVMDIAARYPRDKVWEILVSLYDMYADVTWISYAGIYATWIGAPEGNEQEYVFQFGDDLVPELNVLGGLTYVFATDAVMKMGTRK